MRRRRLTTVAAVAVATLAATATHGQNRQPDWLKKPTPESLLALFPVQAYRMGVGGRATITCVVTVQGTLRACKVVSEKPAGYGFGGAALGLAPQFLMRPAMKDGHPVESEVTIPINWEGMGGPETGSYLPPSPTASDRVYSHIPFREAPSFADVLAAYPEKARSDKVGGAVTLNCRILKEGGLGGCDTVREEPKRLGFANAAKALIPKFVAPTMDSQGRTTLVNSRVLLVVTFPAGALSDPAPVIGKPQWLAIPKVNDMASVVPAAARKAGVYKARVLMTCKVVAGGAVQGCQTQSEDPAGLGYGPAAEMLSKYFKLTVWTDEGLPTVGGTIRIPLRFDLEPPAAGPAKP